MKKILILAIFFSMAFFTSVGQSDMDAFRFSQTEWQGTARFMGAGGAFGAIGAEFSALNINPAAIGVYKKSEITFTPLVVSIMNSTAQYNGSSSPYLSTNYNLNNAGIVITIPLEDKTKWNAVQMGFGYNRIKDYNNTFRIEGTSKNSSIADQLINMANGTSIDNLQGDAELAFMTWFIDSLSGGGNQYYSHFSGQNVKQKKYTHTSGAIDEMIFTFGGNYNDQLYIGMTVGVPFINYREQSTYSEIDEEGFDNLIDEFRMEDALSVKGIGVNLKLGLIYQPVDFFRLGLAFHTPTYYGNMKDHFTRSMISYFDDGGDSDVYEYSNTFNYKLNTPLRAIGSVAFLIQKRAFISADYEFTNYALANMFANDYSFVTENEEIRNKYGVSHTIRVGTEIYLTENFLVRLGYNFMSNPYKNEINHSPAHLAAAGVGLRFNSFFVDLAYNIKFSQENYWMYDAAFVTASENNYTTHKVAATVGFKF